MQTTQFANQTGEAYDARLDPKSPHYDADHAITFPSKKMKERQCNRDDDPSPEHDGSWRVFGVRVDGPPPDHERIGMVRILKIRNLSQEEIDSTNRRQPDPFSEYDR